MVAPGSPFTIDHLEVLALDPPCLVDEQIEGLLAGLDFEEAGMRLLARLIQGGELPPAMVAGVTTRVHVPALNAALFLAAGPGMGDVLLGTIDHDEYPSDQIGRTAWVFALLAAWHLAPALAPRVAAHVRAAAVDLETRLPPDEVVGTLMCLALMMEDEGLAAAFRARRPAVVADQVPLTVVVFDSFCRLAPAERAMLAVQSLEATAPGVQETFEAVRRVVRAQAQGRNAPCWCQSGKKFKRCHGASTGAPTTTGTLAGRSPSALSAVDVLTAPLPELGALVLTHATALADEPLAAALDRLLKYRAWRHVDAAFEAYATRTHLPVELRDGNRIALFDKAAIGGHFERARHYIASVESVQHRRLLPAFDLAIALRAGGAEAFATLARVAEVAVRDTAGLVVNLLPTILDVAPALGLLLVRGCLSVEHPADSEAALRLAERARRRLQLAGEDPLWEAFAARQTLVAVRAEVAALTARLAEARAEGERRRQAASDASVRAQVAEARCVDLTREVERLTAQVASERADPAQVRGLRERIAELQELLRESNVQRTALRNQLSRAPSEAAAAPPVPDTAPATEPTAEDEVDGEVDTEGRIRIPTWQRAAIDGLHEVPRSVAREALRTAAALGTGEVAPWRQVKRLKGRSGLLAVRIGIHHRMLFELAGDALEIVEVVSRSGLARVIKPRS